MVKLKDAFSEKDYHEYDKKPYAIMGACGIPEITESQTKNTDVKRVTIHPEGATHKISATIGVKSNSYKLIEAAANNKERIIIRVQQKLKGSLTVDDLPVPFAPYETEDGKKQKGVSTDLGLANEYTIRGLVGVYNMNTKEWILENENAVPPSDDSEIITSFLSRCIDYSISPDDFFHKEPEMNNVKQTPNVSMNLWQEAERHVLTFYWHLISEKEKRDDMNEVSAQVISDVAVRLLRVADEIQKYWLETDVVNHKGFAHTTARKIVFETINLIPLTNESVKDLDKWQNRLYLTGRKSIEMIRGAMQNYEI